MSITKVKTFQELESALRFAIKHSVNVMLTGKHGVGKTKIIDNLWEEAKLCSAYFSAPSTDPFLELGGIPKEVDGQLVMLPPAGLDIERVEAIFVDELNRGEKHTRNFLMQLIQKKSINGIQFPKLRMVWAAINPEDSDSEDDSEDTYDVERLDPAQKDRFPIQLHVPYDVNPDYFTKKYGKNGKVAVSWWQGLGNSTNKQIQKDISPRRLDYAMEMYNLKEGDLRWILPKEAPIKKLLADLTHGLFQDRLLEMYNASPEEKAAFARNPNNMTSIHEYITEPDRTDKEVTVLWDNFVDAFPAESMVQMLNLDWPTQQYMVKNFYKENIRRFCISAFNTNKLDDSDITKLVKDYLKSEAVYDTSTAEARKETYEKLKTVIFSNGSALFQSNQAAKNTISSLVDLSNKTGPKKISKDFPDMEKMFDSIMTILTIRGEEIADYIDAKTFEIAYKRAKDAINA